MSTTTNNLNALSAYGNMKDTISLKKESVSRNDIIVNFEDALNNAIKGAIDTGKIAENKTALGLSGGGNLTDIATSVEEAKLTLQTSTTIKDRAVQAYQDIMKMSI